VIFRRNDACCGLAPVLALLVSPLASAGAADYAKAEMDPAAGYRVVEPAGRPGPGQGPAVFVTIHFDGTRWQPDSIFHDAAMVQKGPGQEVLYVTEDRRFWRLAVPSPMVNCPAAARAVDAPYTVCNSAFGHVSSIGAVASVVFSLGTSMLDAKPVVLDDKLVRQAVFSVPEAAVSQLLADDEQRQAQDRQLQHDVQSKIAADLAQKSAVEQKAAADQAKAETERMAERMAVVQNSLHRQPQGATLFCQTDDEWRHATGDSLDRQRLVCHVTGQPNMDPIMGSWLLSNGWTIQSEMRRMDRHVDVIYEGTVEVTTATFRKTTT